MYNVLLPFVYSRGKVYRLYFSHSLALSDHLISQWLEVSMMLLDDTLPSRPISTRLGCRELPPLPPCNYPRYLSRGSGDNYLMRIVGAG